jgi:hypothetical protein
MFGTIVKFLEKTAVIFDPLPCMSCFPNPQSLLFNAASAELLFKFYSMASVQCVKRPQPPQSHIITHAVSSFNEFRRIWPLFSRDRENKVLRKPSRSQKTRLHLHDNFLNEIQRLDINIIITIEFSDRKSGTIHTENYGILGSFGSINCRKILMYLSFGYSCNGLHSTAGIGP